MRGGRCVQIRIQNPCEAPAEGRKKGEKEEEGDGDRKERNRKRDGMRKEEEDACVA